MQSSRFLGFGAFFAGERARHLSLAVTRDFMDGFERIGCKGRPCRQPILFR